MKRKTVVIICIVLAVAMILAIVGPIAIGGMYSIMSANAASTSELNDKLNKNKQNQSALQKELNETMQEKKEIQAKKEQLDSDISELATQIDSINKSIAQNESDISQKQAEIKKLENSITESDELLKKRLRVMYEKGNSTYMEVLFSATSFSDLLVRMDMVQQLYDHDQKLIASLNSTKKTVEAAKAEIETAKAANVDLKSQLATQKGAIQSKSNESDAIIDKLAQSESEIKAQIAAKEKENNSILSAIAAAKAQQQSSGTKIVNTYTGGSLGWPSTSRGTITSTFGWRTFRGVQNNHTGIDIAVPTGTPVLACEDGVVTGSGWRNSYGYCVTIDHGSITTLYAHNSVLQCSVGQQVKRGQQIALAGSTGNSTGPHIHLGVIKGGQYVNPAPYIGL